MIGRLSETMMMQWKIVVPLSSLSLSASTTTTRGTGVATLYKTCNHEFMNE